LLPVSVQGERAESEVLTALARIPALNPDVVLITRGGGSLEDLWTFNLERVARAVAACPVPTVSAVGHQTDVTITDFVADVRAPTPSAGAELITPDRADLDAYLSLLNSRLNRAFITELASHTHQLRHLRARLTDPRTRLLQQMQRADELAERLRRAITRRLHRHHAELGALGRSLSLLRPSQAIQHHRHRLGQLSAGLAAASQRNLAGKTAMLAAAARTLQAVSPLSTLARGYAVLTRDSAGHGRTPVTSIRQARIGDTLTAHLHDGALEVRLEGVDADNRLPKLP
jgi:exodeoxyribonuclease VII large subunit